MKRFTRHCDHGIKLTDYCQICEDRYQHPEYYKAAPASSDERTPGFIATHPTITIDINRRVDLLSIHKSINDARIGNLGGFMLEYWE